MRFAAILCLTGLADTAASDRKLRLTDMYLDGKLEEEEFNSKKVDLEGGIQSLKLRLLDAQTDLDNKERV